MSEFYTFLKLGFKHITDLNGYDHILFILALCAIYKTSEWRKVGLLVTAFTIGHSITLALATLKILKVNNNLVELLIPITILITCIFNFFYTIPERRPLKEKSDKSRYLMALFFGLIHGMGFSNYLRSLLGREESIVKPLFSFNLGLEGGQLVIVFISMLFTWLLINVFHVKQQNWKIGLSGFIAAASLFLIKNAAIFA